MKIPEFVAKYLGKHITIDGDFPKENPYQCWDLAAAYARDVVGVPWPHLPTLDGSVISTFSAFPWPLATYFVKVPNNLQDPEKLPLKGDLVIFNGSWGGGYGHIGLKTDNSANLVLFEQNNPTGSPPRLVTHPTSHYGSVAGWLRPKKTTEEEDMKPASYEVANIYAQELLFRDMPRTEWEKFHQGKTRDQLFDDFRNADEREVRLAEWKRKAQTLDEIDVKGQALLRSMVLALNPKEK